MKKHLDLIVVVILYMNQINHLVFLNNDLLQEEKKEIRTDSVNQVIADMTREKDEIYKDNMLDISFACKDTIKF